MKAALEKAAAADRRTLASLVEKILADWLAGNAPAQTSPIAQEGIKIMKPIRFKKIAALSGSVADVPNPVAQPKKPGGKP